MYFYEGASGFTKPIWQGYPSQELIAAVPDELSYEINGNSVAITDCDESASGKLVIPSIIEGKPVTTIGNSAFSNCSSVTSVVITGNVTSIGDSAFSSCSSLTSVEILGSVTSIGDSAFSYCSSLANAVIPDGIIAIEEALFNGCTSLTNVEIPDSVTSIGDAAFSDCSSLTSVLLPNSIIHIGDSAFSDCSGLTGLEIPDTVTSIGASAFSYCSSLTNMVIPGSVTTLGGSAFSYCASLTSVTFLGDAPGTFGTSVFDFVASGFIVYFYEGGSGYTAPTWHGYASEMLPRALLVLSYEIDGNSVLITDCDESASGSLEIPAVIEGEPVTSIRYSAFEGCAGLTSVSIPDGVTSIGNFAFDDCTSLTSVSMPDTVTSIGIYAFDGCASLAGISLPESLVSIGDDAFRGCSDLAGVDIPDSVTSIGRRAFRYCVSLASVTIGDGVTGIGDYAFEECTSLMSVTIGSSVTGIGDSAFKNCTELMSLSLPGGVTSIGSSAFNGCASLTSVSLPDGISSIDDYAFGSCTSLTSISIPDSVTSMGISAFYGCTSLAELSLSAGLTRIEDYAFRSCTSLTSVSIPEGVTRIDDSAFDGCTGLSSVSLPSSLTRIEDSVFRNCTSLVAISLPDSVTSIGSSAFSYCSSLASVDIPDLVASIGWHTFENCTSLMSVTIGNNVTSIGNYAFDDCTSLRSVKLGNSITKIGDYAFYNCSSLTSVSIPDSVSIIGYLAFYVCDSLTSAIFEGAAPLSFDANAFGHAAYDFTVYFYEGATGFTTPVWQGYTSVVLNLTGDEDGDGLPNHLERLLGTGPLDNEDVIFAHPVFTEGVMRVEIDLDDALDVDNRAWIAVKPSETVKTLLVSDGESSNGYYLKRALALSPDVELSEIPPDAYRATDEFELTLFDAHVPNTLPAGTSVFFNALPDIDGLTPTGMLEAPPILGVDRTHPVMRYLNPGNVGISQAMTFATPPGSTELLTTTGSPLIADVSRGDRQILVVGFELSQSDWPLKLSFPLFVQNVVSWVPSQGTSYEQYLQAGTPIEVLPDGESTEVQLTLPDGSSETLRMESTHPVYFGGTQRAGLYEVSRGELEYTVAVNLADALESDIAPAESLAFGRSTIEATEKSVNTTRELWPWFVLVALCVLQLEWWIYTRRAWI